MFFKRNKLTRSDVANYQTDPKKLIKKRLGKRGRYQLLDVIGVGGMSLVFKARDHKTQIDVAIKIPKPSDLNFEILFKREIKQFKDKHLRHHGIVEFHEAVEDENGLSYLVMGWLGGGSLKERLGRGRYTLHGASKVLDEVADALDYLHDSRKIVHRDIKPQNIMFDEDGNVYIIDFGIGKITDGTSSTLTGSMVVGTLEYISPEQLSTPAQVTSKADQYSLALVVYAMLAGRLPYDVDIDTNANSTVQQLALMQAHTQQKARDIRELRSDLPDALWPVLERALKKDPQERYPDIKEFAYAFATVAASVEEASGNFGDVSPFKPRESGLAPVFPNYRMIILATTAAVTVLVVLIGITLPSIIYTQPPTKTGSVTILIPTKSSTPQTETAQSSLTTEDASDSVLNLTSEVTDNAPIIDAPVIVTSEATPEQSPESGMTPAIASVTRTPTLTATNTPTLTLTKTPTERPSPTRRISPTKTPTERPSPTRRIPPTNTPTHTVTATLTPSETATSTPTATSTSTSTPTLTMTPVPTKNPIDVVRALIEQGKGSRAAFDCASFVLIYQELESVVTDNPPILQTLTDENSATYGVYDFCADDENRNDHAVRIELNTDEADHYNDLLDELETVRSQLEEVDD
jgi:eukaryotic-like serine/threonine-protein kinase